MNIFVRILVKLKFIRSGYYVSKGFPINLRLDAKNKFVWLMTKNFLLKFSFKPKIIKRKNFLDYSLKNISKVFNRIHPRFWEIIEYNRIQKASIKTHDLRVPTIETLNYEIPYKIFKNLTFYKYKSRIIVEFDNTNFGAYGHLIIEIFPVLIFLSKKIPLLVSIKGLEIYEKVFLSFSKIYNIKVINSSNLNIAEYLISKKLISGFNLKVGSKNSYYEYPNYNNILLMQKYLPETDFKRINFGKHIYVLRKKNTSSGRRLLNEDKLINELTKLGFKTFCPEDYSLEDQISIFSMAETVIGVSGSALLNCIFCKKNTNIIEIAPDLDFRPGVFIATIISESNHYFSIGKSLDVEFTNHKPAKFSVNIFSILKMVHKIKKLS